MVRRINKNVEVEEKECEVESFNNPEDPKVKRTSKWVVALKKFNEGKKYTIPKRGSDEYNSVLELMKTL